MGGGGQREGIRGELVTLVEGKGGGRGNHGCGSGVRRRVRGSPNGVRMGFARGSLGVRKGFARGSSGVRIGVRTEVSLFRMNGLRGSEGKPSMLRVMVIQREGGGGDGACGRGVGGVWRRSGPAVEGGFEECWFRWRGKGKRTTRCGRVAGRLASKRLAGPGGEPASIGIEEISRVALVFEEGAVAREAAVFGFAEGRTLCSAFWDRHCGRRWLTFCFCTMAHPPFATVGYGWGS